MSAHPPVPQSVVAAMHGVTEAWLSGGDKADVLAANQALRDAIADAIEQARREADDAAESLIRMRTGDRKWP